MSASKRREQSSCTDEKGGGAVEAGWGRVTFGPNSPQLMTSSSIFQVVEHQRVCASGKSQFLNCKSNWNTFKEAFQR